MASVTVDVDVVNSWQSLNSSNIVAGNITATQAARIKPDLRDVSTRDLLNEAFRRGAIKQMNVKRMVASEMIKDPNYVEHMQRSIRQDALAGAVDDLEKYGVFNVGKSENVSSHPWEDVEYSVDYFICKHPLTLKKEEGIAY